MTRLVLWLLLAFAAPSLAAQRAGPPDSARAERLRGQIERRFGERVRQELGLSEAQAGKLRATQERFGERRRPLMQRQRAVRHALRTQMRPGQAADPDSVRKLLGAMEAGRAAMFELEQAERREMDGYLTPVQHAQFLMLRERLHRRVEEMRRDGPRAGHRRPGERDGPRDRHDGPPRKPTPE
jgi:hypothetical protein